MTSWVNRIHCVAPVLKMFLNNTRKPDIVFLSLSLEEFPNREQSLPKKLLDEVESSNGVVRLNWVPGPNTKPWKKVFPILHYLDDDDLIILADDDLLPQNNLVETRVNEFNEQCGRFAITGGGCYKNTHIDIDLLGIGSYNTICPTSILSKKMLNGWENFMCDEVVSTYHDDCIYSMLCVMNGYKMIPSSKLNLQRDPKVEKIAGMHLEGLCRSDLETIDVFAKRYEDVYGDSFKKRVFNVLVWDSWDCAGDNGEFFYRKAREICPCLNMTFLLSRTSPHWDRLLADGFNLYPFEGNQIEYLMKNSNFILWSKDGNCRYYKEKILPLVVKYRSKSLFFQHGVINEAYIPLWYYGGHLPSTAQYIISSSDEESEIIERSCGGKMTTVPCGLSRWDILMEKLIMRRHSTSQRKKRVLVTFHWRAGKMYNDERFFANSQYIHNINRFLNCQQLKNLVDMGIEVVFRIHSMMKKYAKYFQIPSYVTDGNDCSFQDLLIDCDVMVTDFSSNTFEQAYMGKKSICWIPDREDIEYAGEDCDYHPDKIAKYGHIMECRNLEQVFSSICGLLKSGNRLMKFDMFKYHDMDNTLRLINWLYGKVQLS